MKTLITFIFGMSLCATLIAQRDFHLLYDYNLKSDFGNAIVEETDGSLISFGMKTGGGVRSGFLKVDSTGSTVFHKMYHIRNDNSNSGGKWGNKYYSVGSHFNPTEGSADSHIFFVKSNGDSARAVPINFEFNDRIHDAIVKPDSTFIVYGFYRDSMNIDNFPFIANVDSLGNVLWFQTHNDSSLVEEVTNMEATQDGGYVLAGKEKPNTSQATNDLFLIKVDSLGNFLWKQTYPEPLNQAFGYVTTCQNGDFALVGTGYSTQKARQAILRTDSAGNLLWRRKYGNPLYDEGFQYVKELPSGDFICAGNNTRLSNGQQVIDVNLTRLDSQGNLIWSKSYNYYDTTIHQYVRDLILTSDGGFAMTGFITFTPFPQRNDVFILKTDGNGVITGVNNGFQMVDNTLSVYPNPTKGNIQLQTDKRIESIEVFDLQGKQLTHTATQSIMTNKEIKLPQPSGMYLVRVLFQDGTVRTEKVIKE